jgi:hypothetical protein
MEKTNMVSDAHPMTARQRMLAAYHNQQPDALPVSPEIWDATTVEVLGRPWHELLGPFAKTPWWQSHLHAFEFFAADAWILAAPSFATPAGCSAESDSYWISPDEIETCTLQHTPHGNLRTLSRSTATYAFWSIEHPMKRFPEDMHSFEPFFFPDVENIDVSEIETTIAGVGEKGLVTVYLGDFFTSALANNIEGGYTAVINALLDLPNYCRQLQQRYIAFQAELAEAICTRTRTRAEALFVHSGYSALPITSPRIYRDWDMPALTAVGRVAKQHGVALHVHQHGHTAAIAEDLIAAGVTMVCPLLAPPQGDVSDLAAFKMQFGARIGMKGNIDPFGVLRNGTPEQVEQEVRACVAAGAPGGGFILGTQDSTLPGTPFENIHALVRAGRQYGCYNQ